MFFETQYKNFDYLIGCDEVGRGPIAGPVVGCAVFMRHFDKKSLAKLRALGVTDSKKLSSKKRRNILAELKIDLATLECGKKYKILSFPGFAFCLYQHSPETIDKINILNASLDCMFEASARLELKSKTGLCLIDGNKLFKRKASWKTEAIIKGDSKSILIALASIIAKEFRDEIMLHYDQIYPGLGLASNAGYPTRAHLEGLALQGITPIHRKTFRGVKEYVKQQRSDI